MDPEKRRSIASKGGKAAHKKGTAHRFTSDEARAAGRKGGLRAHEKQTAHRFTSEEARAAAAKAARNKERRRGNGKTPEPPTESSRHEEE
jgi:hypothetical protein